MRVFTKNLNLGKYSIGEVRLREKHQDEKAFKLQTDYEDFILYVKTICNAYIVAGGVINDHADDESWQSLTA